MSDQPVFLTAPSQDRRLATVSVSYGYLLAGFFPRGRRPAGTYTVQGVPETATLVAVRPGIGVAELLFEDASFGQVADGAIPPELHPTIHVDYEP